jgi:linoleoyl-CoA desaturase
MYKVISLVIFIITPMIMVGVVDTIIGYLIMTLVAGFILSIVFQLAHTVEHTHFPMPNEISGKMEDEWAIHQIKTTANFATRNSVVSWFVGGLNFQIEHHLFPKISHIHYPQISKIIRQACKEYNITYVEYKHMLPGGYFSCIFLKTMGTA